MTTLSDLFTAGARRYDLLVGADPGYHRHLRLAAERLVRHRRPRRALDLGCGTGASTRALLEAAPEARILGVDAAHGMIEQARAKQWPAGRVEFAVGLAGDETVTAPSAPFDVCLAAYLLRNVPAAERDRVLRSIRDQLGPGGVLAVQDYSVAGSWRSARVWDAVCWLVIVPLAALVLRDTRLFRYLWRSVRDMEGVEVWCARMDAAGLEVLEVHHGSSWQRGILHTVIARRPEQT